MSLCEKCYYGDKYCNLRGHGGSGEVISCTKAARLKHKTNADKIRQMSDEELAEWHYEHQSDCPDCLAKSRKCMASNNTCKKAWLDWLKQEVESDG